MSTSKQKCGDSDLSILQRFSSNEHELTVDLFQFSTLRHPETIWYWVLNKISVGIFSNLSLLVFYYLKNFDL